MFIGRETELQFLENHYKKEGSKLLVVYGQKAVGKTALLKRFCEGKHFMSYSARCCSEREQRYQWAKELNQEGSSLPEYPTYTELFEEMFRRKIADKYVCVIDDFHYLLKTDDSFFKQLVDFMRTNTDREMFVVLCTSASGWVENSMVRRMGSLALHISGLLKVRQMTFEDMRKIYPDFSKKDSLGIYSILGGIPGFWNSFSADLSLEKNVIQNILCTNSRLYGELSVLLAEELREPAVYSTILSALANHCNKLNDIYKHTGFSRAKISVYLKNLMELDLVEKVYSFETDSYADTQKGVYRISNPYVHFYFRFIFSNISALQRLDDTEFFNRYIAEKLPEYMEETYRKICRETLREEGMQSGEWLGKSCSLDVVSRKEDGDFIAGICSLTKEMSMKDYEWLVFAVKKAKLSNPSLRLYCEQGFTSELTEFAKKEDIELISIL